jgi:hypothetical protein
MAIPPFTTSRTQNCWQTPFESPPDRANGFSAKNAQEAIEEALALAVSNDRIVLLPSYGGNANVGRYLEFWPTLDSLNSPVSLGTTVKCLYLNFATVSTNATCTIGFYDINPVTPTLLYTATFSAVKQVIQTSVPATPLFTIPSTGKLAIKIDSGSINKPYGLIALSATL